MGISPAPPTKLRLCFHLFDFVGSLRSGTSTASCVLKIIQAKRNSGSAEDAKSEEEITETDEQMEPHAKSRSPSEDEGSAEERAVTFQARRAGDSLDFQMESIEQLSPA